VVETGQRTFVLGIFQPGTFSPSAGNFYGEYLPRHKSPLSKFEQFTSACPVAYWLLQSFSNGANGKQINQEAKMKTQMINSRISRWALIVASAAAIAGCAGGPMTTREQGAAIGALGGAAAGGAIGSAFHRPGMGAAIGAGTGLGAGALIGDYMQGKQQDEYR
jgi:YMGG-like Gly-zipper